MTMVTDQNGQPVPDANWGDTDLSGIDMRKYPHIDPTERVTITGGLTGPRYVRDSVGGIGDVSIGRSVSVQTAPPFGYDPRDAEADEHRALCNELTSQRQ